MWQRGMYVVNIDLLKKTEPTTERPQQTAVYTIYCRYVFTLNALVALSASAPRAHAPARRRRQSADSRHWDSHQQKHGTREGGHIGCLSFIKNKPGL